MELTHNARKVLEARYLIKDKNGRPQETPEQLFARVAQTAAAVDARYEPSADVRTVAGRFYSRMAKLEFLPNSPTLMNAGRPLGQLSACFVLPVEDSMEDIFEAVKQAALIHKSGGGTGFSFSRLRPQGSAVNSTGGVASGPVSFMRVFNAATEAVKQGGTRRGANMGILRADHPDIMAFINCKKDGLDITNFNISVGVTEAFLHAAQTGEAYDLIDPHTRRVTGRLNARTVFDAIVNAAWHNGEPGMVFLDRINRDNAVPCEGDFEATNPCGEQPLLPFESCNLGSVNLAHMLKDTDGTPEIDWDELAAVVRDAVHFLDNVIDANRYPLPQINDATKKTRKVGLGVMGFADLLLILGVPYDSNEAVRLGERLMAFIEEKGHEASRALARARGAFPLFDRSTLAGGMPRRNATVTTIAPTGTLSILAGCSGGIEPVFAFAFTRNVLDGAALPELNPVLARTLQARGLLTTENMRRIAAEGTLANLDDIPADLRRVFVCAHDIAPEAHIRMQAAFQRHTDNAVSKTVNFPHNATPEDVRRVFLLAWQEGCKGVTVYRDGSRDAQVLQLGTQEQAQETPAVRRWHSPAAAPGTCPECGARLEHTDGCVLCRSCGYSACM